jgi:hypothetical protein
VDLGAAAHPFLPSATRGEGFVCSLSNNSV